MITPTPRELIDDYITEATRILEGASGAAHSAHHAMALTFWKKILSSARAVVVLHDNRLIDEAETINRLSLENLFLMVASLRDQTTVDRLHNDARQDVRKVQASSCDKEAKVLDETRREVLEALGRDSILAEAAPAVFSIYEAAGVAGLESLYQSRYRVLSTRSAHASFISVTKTGSADDADEVLASTLEILALARAHVEHYVRAVTV